jgi:hypothetical protein
LPLFTSARAGSSLTTNGASLVIRRQLCERHRGSQAERAGAVEPRRLQSVVLQRSRHLRRPERYRRSLCHRSQRAKALGDRALAHTLTSVWTQ